MKTIILTAIILLCVTLCCYYIFFMKSCTLPELSEKQTNDIHSIKLYRNGLASIIEFTKTRPDLFPKKQYKKPEMLTKDARSEALMVWKSLLDYYMALDSIAELHRDIVKTKKGTERKISFFISRAALLAEYRFALDFIHMAENNPALDTLFNEPAPDLGLPGGIYADFKYRFLNIMLAGEFTAFETIAKYYGPVIDDDEFNAFMEEDKKRIFAAGKGEGPELTLKNGFKIITDTSKKVLFPVQKGISSWMGNTKVYRKDRYLIKESQIKEFERLLEPGDILLERREWYLTNVGIPGFWSHAALFIGSASQRNACSKDPDTLAWIKKQGADNFETLLSKNYPDAYKRLLNFPDKKHSPRVIEAVAAGVIFSTLEHSALCDSLVVLRPRLSIKEKMAAIFNAFKYSGRPYDYNFDFLTDSSLVCSELVYKAYEFSKDTRGLKLPLEKLMGHMVTPANAFAKLYADEYGTDKQQMDMVLFMDGYERDQKAIKSDLKAFLKTWKRPKWHIITQTITGKL